MNPSSTMHELTNPAPRVRPGSSALPSAKPGRPSSFSMEKVLAICTLIREEGLSEGAAGARVGVPHTTLSRWKAKYEEAEVELAKARALYQRPRLERIAQARRKDGALDWRAQAWLMKFSAPQQYGPPSRRRRLCNVILPMDDRLGKGNHDLAERGQGAEPKSVTISPETPAETSTARLFQVDRAKSVTISPETSSDAEAGTTNSVTFSPETRVDTHFAHRSSPADQFRDRVACGKTFVGEVALPMDGGLLARSRCSQFPLSYLRTDPVLLRTLA